MNIDRSVGRDVGGPRPAASMLRIERLPYAHPVVQELVEEVQSEYVVRYGGPDGAPIQEEMFDPPTGAFFVAFLHEEPVATGAWRTRDGLEAFGSGVVAEVKRMYVRAAVRRNGVARAVLAHLEATAAQAGADVLVLETGLKQPEAIRLYESSGYEPVPPFGHYKDHPHARHLGKRLTPRPLPESLTVPAGRPASAAASPPTGSGTGRAADPCGPARTRSGPA